MKQQALGAMTLQVAYVGVTNRLFDALAARPGLGAAALAAATDTDPGYVDRWCDVAYAFELLDRDADGFLLTALGASFRPDAPDTQMPFAIQTILGAHMAERAAGLMRTGERPGESVLAEPASVMPWYGPMIEAHFRPLFEREILPALPIFRRVDERGGLAVDLGCGNGWYLRALALRCPQLRGIGLDGFAENVRGAAALAEAAGLAGQLEFREGNLHHFTVAEPVDLIAMNRALHHVWDQKENVARILAEHLAPGGAAVIWEPRWPDDPTTLREPPLRNMAFQNLSEHVQGNRFLRPDEVTATLEAVGLDAAVHLFAEGHEMVIVGTRR